MGDRYSKQFVVAKLGRAVGLKGDIKIHLLTDFPEQFFQGVIFDSSKGKLQIASFDPKRMLIRFKGYDSPEKVRTLTNALLYANEEETRQRCNLKEGEFFWFEIIGLDVIEEDETVGTVSQIQRMAGIDYLAIKTSNSLVEQGYAKSFLLPYIDRYVVATKLAQHCIIVRDAKAVLEAS